MPVPPEALTGTVHIHLVDATTRWHQHYKVLTSTWPPNFPWVEIVFIQFLTKRASVVAVRGDNQSRPLSVALVESLNTIQRAVCSGKSLNKCHLLSQRYVRLFTPSLPCQNWVK